MVAHHQGNQPRPERDLTLYDHANPRLARSSVVGLFRKNDREAEMMEEIRQHLDLLTERNIAAGMSPDEARNAARREFGGVEQIKEIAREERIWMWPEQLWKDFRFALRQLRKSPAFTLVAILTLALGIGANVAIFSVVNAVLLRPFAFAQPEKLIWIWSQRPQTMRGNFTLPEFCDYRDQNTLLDGLAAIASYNANLTDQSEAERVQGVRLSANIFQILGVQPLLGRVLDAADDRPGAPAVALISHGLWARRYGKQSSVIGTNVTLNGEPRVIVGVLPPDFVLPNLDSEVVVPLQPESDPREERPELRELFAHGRPDQTGRVGGTGARGARFDPAEFAAPISGRLCGKDRRRYRAAHGRDRGELEEHADHDPGRGRRVAFDRVRESGRHVAGASGRATTRTRGPLGPGRHAHATDPPVAGGKRRARDRRRRAGIFPGDVGIERAGQSCSH